MISKLFLIAGISVLIYLGLALGLILSQRPAADISGPTLDFDRLAPAEAGTFPHLDRTTYTGADGQAMPMTHVNHAPPNAPLIVMVHGSGWHGQQFDRLAAALGDRAEIRAITLRGHGPAPARRGDIDYIGQFEDDLAAAIGDVPETRKVYLLGHSSGGGLVIRFAGGAHRDLIDGAILLAPYLHHAAPTMRDNSGGWARPLLRRIIGLSMLNVAGLHQLDHLTAIQFAFPQAVLDRPGGEAATSAYSWRLNLSYAPRRAYLEDIAALPRFLLVAGTADEAFRAEAYQPTMTTATPAGQYLLLEGVGHLDVVDAPDTEIAIRAFLDDG